MKNLFPQILGCIALVIAGGLLLSMEVRAQQQAGPAAPKKEVSLKVSEGLAKLKEYTEANNAAKSLELIDELLKVAEPGDTYDQALLNLYKGNIILPFDDSRPAIAPLERVLDITSRVDLLSRFDVVQAYRNLSIVYYLASERPDATPAQRVTNLNLAITRLESFFKFNGEPSPDEANQYASFLFRKATLSGDDDKVDMPTIKLAREVAQKGILRSTVFRPDLYRLVLTAYQYEKNLEATAETLELLLAQKPSESDAIKFWQLLPRTYLALAQDLADKQEESQANEYRWRAILAYERAQKSAGLYNGEKGEDSTMDLMQLAKAYADVGQLERGAEIMLEGARTKKIKGNMTDKVWLFIADFYRQLGKTDKTIAVLKEAAGNFPQDGQFDLQLSNIYYSLDQTGDAIKSIQDAIRKGVPGRESDLRLSESYYLYSANRFKEASESAAKGLALPGLTPANSAKLKQIKDAADTAQAAKDAARDRLN